MKQIIYFAVILLLSLIIFAQALEPAPPPEILIEEKETIIYLDELENYGLEFFEPVGSEEYRQVANKCEQQIINASNLRDSLHALGYGEEHPAVRFAERELEYYEEAYGLYFKGAQQLAEEERWQEKMKKYPVATEVWLYMKDLGWSDSVCAGIMGNMMSEVGGKTLKLDPSLYYKDTYYGICQWSKKYYPQIWGRSLEEQCHFLRDTIKKELDTYGKLYATGMNYEKFLQMEDCSEAALCFAQAYERCSSGGYAARQSNAKIAYRFFTE